MAGELRARPDREMADGRMVVCGPVGTRRAHDLSRTARRCTGGYIEPPHQKATVSMTTPEGSAPPALLLRLPLLAGDTTLTDRYAPTRAAPSASPAPSLLR